MIEWTLSWSDNILALIVLLLVFSPTCFKLTWRSEDPIHRSPVSANSARYLLLNDTAISMNANTAPVSGTFYKHKANSSIRGPSKVLNIFMDTISRHDCKQSQLGTSFDMT